MNLRTFKWAILKLPFVTKALDLYRHRTRESFRQNQHLIAGARALEVGGPSRIFSKAGAFPIYEAVKTVDNANWSSVNFWSQIDEGQNFRFHPDKPPGRQYITDATDLSAIPSATYDLVMSSHVIEHIANPLKALREWRRVIRPGGYMVLIAPDRRFTYDIHRPLTTIEHLVEDYDTNMQEDDETHLQEIIDLHDIASDGTGVSLEEHIKRTRNNFSNRMAHHHVFDDKLVQAMVGEAGFEVLQTDVFRQYHILVIAKNPG